MLLVKQWLLCKVLKGKDGEKVIKMHFHYLLLHISRPWTIHLIGCIFFNKFTTNAFILRCVTRGGSLPAEFKYHVAFHVFFPPRPFLKISFFYISREIALELLILSATNSLVKDLQTEACCQFDPVWTEQELSFDRRARGPPLKYLSSCGIRVADTSHTHFALMSLHFMSSSSVWFQWAAVEESSSETETTTKQWLKKL